ncbi:MAG TPA: TRAP transporter substrate-binding protein [Acetobacteraceae bacterium]|nr:TRAP transporter substrate-binding protein [Acetobacteraceae bacterium]
MSRHVATFCMRLWLAFCVGCFLPVAGAAGDEPIRLKILGGLAGVSQYERLEKPFWEQRIEQLSGGRVQAEIHAFDRSGLPGQEMLQLMRLGVVPFGTALLALVSADEPELNLVDLPALNPDMPALRATVAAYRGHLAALLEQKFHIKLLAIYAYPAQVVFCKTGFDGLRGLAGRRVRTSSVGQSELMSALGAIPVLTPFSDIVPSVRAGMVDCAITGTMSGNEIGLSGVTAYISPIAISWGLSIFGANLSAWEAIPADLRAVIQRGVAELERQVWDAADRETAEGLACDTGSEACGPGHKPGAMTLVQPSARAEAERRALLVNAVLPNWLQRCGPDCAAAWNETVGPGFGIVLRAP